MGERLGFGANGSRERRRAELYDRSPNQKSRHPGVAGARGLQGPAACCVPTDEGGSARRRGRAAPGAQGRARPGRASGRDTGDTEAALRVLRGGPRGARQGRGERRARGADRARDRAPHAGAADAADQPDRGRRPLRLPEPPDARRQDRPRARRRGDARAPRAGEAEHDQPRFPHAARHAEEGPAGLPVPGRRVPS